MHVLFWKEGSKKSLQNFRKEINGEGYHIPPSMVNARLLAISNCIDGVGPIFGIYQAHVTKYLKIEN